MCLISAVIRVCLRGLVSSDRNPGSCLQVAAGSSLNEQLLQHFASIAVTQRKILLASRGGPSNPRRALSVVVTCELSCGATFVSFLEEGDEGCATKLLLLSSNQVRSHRDRSLEARKWCINSLAALTDQLAQGKWAEEIVPLLSLPSDLTKTGARLRGTLDFSSSGELFLGPVCVL